MELQKIYTDSAFSNAVIPEGTILTYLVEENGQIVTKTKNSNGEIGTLSGGGGGADVTLGQIDADGNFQPLAFNGTEASNDGSPETVENYYGWNGVLEVPDRGIKVGEATEYYKCASVDSVNKTWTGYLAVCDADGVYTFEETTTTGLTYGTAYTPKQDGIYNADSTVQVSRLWDGSLVPTDGLVFHASFVSDITAADTGQGFTEVSGNPELTVDSGIPCCRLQNSSKLAGNDNSIRFPVGREARSLSVWLKTSNTSQEGYVFSYGTASPSQYFGLDVYDGIIHFAASSNNNSVQYPLTADTWIHIVGVYEYDILRMYANGGFCGAEAFPSQLDTVFTGYSISGQYDSSDYCFDGLVAGCRIYNRALSAEEVAMLYSEFTPTV